MRTQTRLDTPSRHKMQAKQRVARDEPSFRDDMLSSDANSGFVHRYECIALNELHCIKSLCSPTISRSSTPDVPPNAGDKHMLARKVSMFTKYADLEAGDTLRRGWLNLEAERHPRASMGRNWRPETHPSNVTDVYSSLLNVARSREGL